MNNWNSKYVGVELFTEVRCKVNSKMVWYSDAIQVSDHMTNGQLWAIQIPDYDTKLK